jgi:hypothetical protein
MPARTLCHHRIRARALRLQAPRGVALCGSEFIGPAYDPDFDGYPTDEETGRLDIKAIVDSVDFWEIAAAHDKSA